MARHTFHFDHHQREALVNRRRFSTLTALMLMVVLSGVGVVIKSYSHAAVSSTTFDLAGYKIDTANSANGPFSGATVQLYRASNGSLIQNQTPNPWHYASVTAASAGENFTIKIASPTTYSGWTIKGSTYCASSGCNTFDQQTSSFVAGASRTLNLIPGRTYNMRWIWEYKAPTAPVLSGSVNATSGAVNLSWSASSQAGGAVIYNYYLYNGSAGQDLGNNRGYTTTLPCGTAYSYSIKALDQYNHYSASSNTLAGSTQACPTPVPVTPKPATPVPTTPKPATPVHVTPKPVTVTPVAATPRPVTQTSTSSGTTTIISKPPVVAAPKPGVVAQPVAGASVDTTAPSIPDGFTASTSSTGNDISLSWSAATDTSGIKQYNIERSTDQTNWTTLANPVETAYDDTDIEFSTHYYYRLTATDVPGNTSQYAFADATSAAYESNVGESDVMLSSDDGIASVTIVGGTLPDGADCSVTAGDATITLAKNQAALAGPYKLLCRDASGDEVASFAKPLSWSYSLSASRVAKYKKPAGMTIDDSGKGKLAKSAYDGKKHIVTFEQTVGSQSYVLASKKASIPFNLIVGILVVIGVFVGAIVFILRRRQQSNYSEYIRSKYYDI